MSQIARVGKNANFVLAVLPPTAASGYYYFLCKYSSFIPHEEQWIVHLEKSLDYKTLIRFAYYPRMTIEKCYPKLIREIQNLRVGAGWHLIEKEKALFYLRKCPLVCDRSKSLWVLEHDGNLEIQLTTDALMARLLDILGGSEEENIKNSTDLLTEIAVIKKNCS